MKKITHWHKLQIGKWQNRLRIDNYETMWLSWLKGIITGVILMSLLSGCYIYEVPSTSYSQSANYNDYDDLSYYKTHYVPTLDLYYWNNLPYWGYSDGWYYYYGYRHSYPWWYYYQYSPSYHYNIHTHVYCYLNTSTHVQRPRSHRRMDNKNNRTYNVTYVNQNGVSITTTSVAILWKLWTKTNKLPPHSLGQSNGFGWPKPYRPYPRTERGRKGVIVRIYL